MTDKFIMVDLEDKKSKELANVISNDTSRKILDYLSENNSSEGEIAKALNLAPSTVYYNVKQLLQSKLIEVKDFFWSDKGNRVNVYKVSNKLVIIAPKKSEFRNRLKELFVITIIGGVVSWSLFLWTKMSSKVSFAQSLDTTSEKAFMAAERAADAAPMVAEAGGREIVSAVTTNNPFLWFFIGILFAVLLGLLIGYFRRRK